MATPRCRRRQARHVARRRCGSCPEVTSSRPAISRSSVDLPQPDGPTKTQNSPCGDGEVDVLDDVRPAPKRLVDASRGSTSAMVYPFTAPAVRPETMRRCSTSTSRMSGTVTMTEAAMMRPQGSS